MWNSRQRPQVLKSGATATLMVLAVWLTSENFTIRRCIGPSMQPTLPAHRELILVGKVSRWSSIQLFPTTSFQLNDVVIYNSTAKHPQYCKRVVGLEGDVIVYMQTEPRKLHIVEVPRNCVWLAGDNYQYSEDSRSCGPVAVTQLEGRALLKAGLYPRHICHIDRIVPYDRFIFHTEGRISNYGRCYNVTKSAHTIDTEDRKAILDVLELCNNNNTRADHRKYVIDRLTNLQHR